MLLLYGQFSERVYMKLVIAFLLMTFSMISTSNDEKKTIIFFGDSITAGYGIGTELAFPNLIQAELIKNGYVAEVVNAGLSGETSAGGLSRIDWILKREFDVFVLELGANDGLRGLPVSETEKNLQAIINRVRGKYPEIIIVLAGMRVPPNMGEDYALSFQAVYPRLAKKNNIQLIPFILKDVAGMINLNQPDGIHPNSRGHKVIAENIYPIFSNLF